MTSQSPQRNRKLQPLPTNQVYEGPMQTTSVPRDTSPSPSFRERQRTIKAHSMSLPPSVGQALSGQSQQVAQQPSPTSGPSHPPRRSPPPGSRISPVAAKVSATNTRDRSPERRNSSPSLIHTHIPPFVPTSSQPPPNALAHLPRPVPRVPPPQFLSQFHSDEKWHVTDQLMAEIERADQEHQGALQGTSGVAYAGGAGGMQYQLPVQAAMGDRMRAADRASPKELDGGKRVREKDKDREVQGARESPKNWERSSNVAPTAPLTDSQVRAQDRTPEYRGSPQYQGPPNPTNERPQVYSHISADSYPAAQPAAPSLPRRATITNGSDMGVSRVTPPGPTKVVTQSPPAQTLSARPPGRSLPVQEEPEEDIAHELPHNEKGYLEQNRVSPGPLPETHQEAHPPRFDGRRNLQNGTHRTEDDDDDEQTLNEDHEDHDKSDEDESSGYTPRSPSTNLPDRPRDGQYPQQNGQYIPPPTQYTQPVADMQKTIRPKPRGGATDQLGMRTFDPAMFTNTINSLRGATEVPVSNGQRIPVSRAHPQTQETLGRQEQTYDVSGRTYFGSRVDSVPPGMFSQTLPSQLPSQLEGLHSFLDDPAASYLQSILQSPGARPGAPIPPTPQTHTAAPSPSPGVSSMPGEFGPRQIGSPYPYPFTHIRRAAMPMVQNTAPSSIDPNNPAVVREQLALQMQIYALNNGLAAASDSTFSPSSTPFPGAGYNPWAFVHHAARAGDSNMSMRSSPSHEPVPMPPIVAPRGRGLRRKEPSANLRPQDNGAPRRRRPPPRVESTQPRDTSPETSSGEETAGEERYDDHLAPEEDQWVNGEATETDADEGEWVDENEDGDDDLLQLEYHPSFVGRTEKRRRRWETRWDALAQAFQALDRETDTTLILLAAPSHSTKLHSLTSRSIRRDPRLQRSKALATIRSSFNYLAAQRRASRTQKHSLVDQLSSVRSTTSVDGSQGEGREEDLRQALEAALGSLGALGTIYEQREARWREEMKRLGEDREHVEILLRQALGPAFVNGQSVTGPTT